MEAILIVIGAILLILIVYSIRTNKEKQKFLREKQRDPAKVYLSRAKKTFMDSDSGKIPSERFEDAITDLTMAIHNDASFADPYLERALLYDEFGKEAKALADYKQYLELSDYKSDSEMLAAYERQKSTNKNTRPPLADPKLLFKSSLELRREITQQRIKELEKMRDK